MTSKWINKDLFGEFQQAKKEEKDKPKGGVFRSALVWKTPEKGTIDTPKVYEGRFIPDKDGKFYEKYFYNMFQSGEQWTFVLCPKTFTPETLEAFCPFCLASQKLYMGSQADKKKAGEYGRKEKFVGNFYVIDDPRDNEAEDDRKVNGTVKLYEFPGKIEAKLKEEITDTKNGLGYYIFDPGEDGYNFILKVLSTKRDKNGKVWPDYSNSNFARRSSALGTDKEIDAIMKETHSLKEYIEGMIKDDSDILSILKKEVIWDLVKDEWNKMHTQEETKKEKEKDIDDSIWDEEKKEEGSDDGETPWNDEEDSDEDLLKELDDL